MLKKISALCLFIFLVIPFVSQAAELVPDTQTTVKAKVLKVSSASDEILPGTNTTHKSQHITVSPLEGNDAGSIVQFDNDYIQLEEGQIFYLTKTVYADGSNSTYVVYSPYRLNTLLFFVILFVVLVVIFGGKQGVRGLLSLIGSMALILYVLLPGIIHGISPIFLSIIISSFIIILGSYVTHGFNKTTSSAVVGMIVTIIFTGILAHFAVHAASLTGFETEESVYLNINTQGKIDFVQLLMGGIVIGLLGVLYDAAIGQAVSVEELHAVAPHLPRWTIYKRAIRIGREHIGALVNILAIAYVGVSLPLLLLFATGANGSISVILNRENFSTEIVRTLIGSIGLILAVPITTWLSVMILIKKQKHVDIEVLKKEEKNIEHIGHHH